MKKLFFALLLAAIAVGLYATNPTAEAFGDFIRVRSDEMIRNETGDGAFGRLLSSFGSELAGSLAARASERRNYYLFSVYTLDPDGDDGQDDYWRFLGIGGQFVPINEPGDADG